MSITTKRPQFKALLLEFSAGFINLSSANLDIGRLFRNASLSVRSLVSSRMHFLIGRLGPGGFRYCFKYSNLSHLMGYPLVTPGQKYVGESRSVKTSIKYGSCAPIASVIACLTSPEL